MSGWLTCASWDRRGVGAGGGSGQACRDGLHGLDQARCNLGPADQQQRSDRVERARRRWPRRWRRRRSRQCQPGRRQPRRRRSTAVGSRSPPSPSSQQGLPAPPPLGPRRPPVVGPQTGDRGRGVNRSRQPRPPRLQEVRRSAPPRRSTRRPSGGHRPSATRRPSPGQPPSISASATTSAVRVMTGWSPTRPGFGLLESGCSSPPVKVPPTSTLRARIVSLPFWSRTASLIRGVSASVRCWVVNCCFDRSTRALRTCHPGPTVAEPRRRRSRGAPAQN